MNNFDIFYTFSEVPLSDVDGLEIAFRRRLGIPWPSPITLKCGMAMSRSESTTKPQTYNAHKSTTKNYAAYKAHAESPQAHHGHGTDGYIYSCLFMYSHLSADIVADY